MILSACGFSLAGDVTPPPGYTPPASVTVQETASVYPLLPADPARGKVVYEEQCAACHGLTGRGDGSQSGTLNKQPEILSDPNIIAASSPAKLFGIITNGIAENGMPAFATVLDDRARWDVTSYLFMMNTDPDQLAAGKTIYEGLCAGCHGITGKGDGESARGLPLQPPDLTNQSILSPRSNQELSQIVTGGSAEVMPAFEKILTPAERSQVVEYIRTLSFANVVIPTAQPAAVGSNPDIVEPDGTPLAEVPPDAPAAVSITGKVINDSGGGIPAGLEVTLRIFDEMAESGTLSSPVAADGSYSFNAVEMKTGRIFIASVAYEDQVFNSQPSFHPGLSNEEGGFVQSENISLDVHISKSTTDISALTAERMHLFIDFPQEGIMQVVELFLISNNGSEVVIPPTDGKKALTFLLPEGASNLQFDDSTLGERYMPSGNGFFDTMPIQPGKTSHQILFAFDLPYEKKATVEVPIPLDATSVSVMVPVDGVTLKSNQLLDGGVRSSQQMSFQVYNGSDFTKDSTLTINLSGSPQAESDEKKLNINPILFGIGILVLAITGTLYYYFWRKEKHPLTTEEIQPVSDREAIMDAIIALDEQFKSGKLSEEAYNQRRSDLKEQLRKSM